MAIGMCVPPPATAGVPTGTGHTDEDVRRSRKSPAACVSVNVSVSPRTVMPLTCDAFPDVNARTPATSASTCAAALGPPPIANACDIARSIVNLNVSAVTLWPDGGENRKPGRIRNV
jgi:hypothetical protein